MFDSIALELDPKIQDFHKKNNYALANLRQLAHAVSKVKLPDDMDEEKAAYCKVKQEELNDAPFDVIYSHLMVGSQKAIMEFNMEAKVKTKFT